MVSGGEIDQPSDMTYQRVKLGDIVIWNGHEKLGKGVCVGNVLGKCTVKLYSPKWSIIKYIFVNETELTVVGHVGPFPFPPFLNE